MYMVKKGVSTQSWVVLLIACDKFSANRTRYSEMGSRVIEMEYLRDFSDFITQGNQWWHHELSALWVIHVYNWKPW